MKIQQSMTKSIPTSLSKVHGKCMANQSPGQDGNSMKWPKVNQVCGTPNQYFHQVCPEMHRKCVVYQRPWNDRNSVKCDQKTMRSLDPLIRIYTKFDLLFIWGYSPHRIKPISFVRYVVLWFIQLPTFALISILHEILQYHIIEPKLIRRFEYVA